MAEIIEHLLPNKKIDIIIKNIKEDKRSMKLKEG